MKSTGPFDHHSMLEEFFEEELKDIYWAEKHLVNALSKMAAAATSVELRASIENHINETRDHIGRLEDIFLMLGKEAESKKCRAIIGITRESDTIMDDTEMGTKTRDVGLIMAIKKIEHYEIATYGGLVQIAETIGRKDIARVLHETLDEEKASDELLTTIAEGHFNQGAFQVKNQ